MNILLCCCAGMSSSILVKNMRDAAKQLQMEDIKIASVAMTQVAQYIGKADLLLVAPQQVHQMEILVTLGQSYHIPVLLIGREEYGNMDGMRVLQDALTQVHILNREEIKMDKVSQFIESKLMPIAVKVGGNKVLTIIRNGMCATMALLIIGSISVLLTSVPVPAIASFLEPAVPFFNAIYSVTTGMMGLFTAASIAYYASVEYDTDIFVSIITSVSTFLVTQFSVEGELSMSGLGSEGLLTAMVVGFVTVKVMEVFKKKNIGIKMPAGVPAAVAESFSSLLPAIVVLAIFAVINIVLGFNINVVIGQFLSPLSNSLNTPWGYAIYHMLCGLVFFCGINSAVVIGVVQAFIMQNGAANEAALAAGEPLKYAATYATDTMIWAGGTGATIGLILLMSMLAKSKYYKTLGRMSVGPAVFNINEPVIFGTPICFNPIFLIPFVLLPGILAFSTYMLMSANIVEMPHVGVVPWTLPPIAVGFVMGGGAISAIVWSAAIVVISIIAYYPFFKIADKQQYEKELKEQAVQPVEEK